METTHIWLALGVAFYLFIKKKSLKKTGSQFSVDVALTLHLGTSVALLHRHLSDDMVRR
jgi:hypothetical protein